MDKEDHLSLSSNHGSNGGGGGLNSKAKGEGIVLSMDHHVKVSQPGQGCHLGPFLFSWPCSYFFPCFVRVLGPSWGHDHGFMSIKSTMA